jgi:hypothetical protein
MSNKNICVRYCEVISIKDDTDSDMIQARLQPEDNDLPDENLPYAFPLLPKMLHIKPKVGEAVLMLLSVSNDGKASQRYYIGPVISQDHKMYKDDYFFGASSYQAGSIKVFDTAPKTNPEEKPTLPNDEDICVRGRKNTDIQLTDDDIRIKAGVKLVDNDKIVFNSTNPAYMKIKYHPNGLYKNGDYKGKVNQCYSTATIVADRINLIGRTSDKTFEVNDEKDLVSDDKIKEILNNAYKLPYGEKLVEILSLLIDCFVDHTHPFPMKKPCDVDQIKQLKEKQEVYLRKGEMLSENIRIN